MPDIQELLTKKDGWFTDQMAGDLAKAMAKPLISQYSLRDQPPSLRLSGMGNRCPKALWHSIHTPQEAEKMPPWAENKFSFGHIVEAWALTLARAAGHTVEGEQDELYVSGIRGHRDAVVDGCVLDVKSCSGYQFEKYKSGRVAQEDSFGYLDQLDGYICASLSDPIVRVKDKGYILAIDKTLGSMVLYEHHYREEHIRERIRSYKEIVSLDRPPRCTCQQVPHGKSGNIALGVRASYEQFKYCCFPRLRTFVYSDGPVYLTRVVRKPDVPEVDRYGNCI